MSEILVKESFQRNGKRLKNIKEVSRILEESIAVRNTLHRSGIVHTTSFVKNHKAITLMDAQLRATICIFQSDLAPIVLCLRIPLNIRHAETFHFDIQS